jgi:hypothetical protein
MTSSQVQADPHPPSNKATSNKSQGHKLKGKKHMFTAGKIIQQAATKNVIFGSWGRGRQCHAAAHQLPGGGGGVPWLYGGGSGSGFTNGGAPWSFGGDSGFADEDEQTGDV